MCFYMMFAGSVQIRFVRMVQSILWWSYWRRKCLHVPYQFVFGFIGISWILCRYRIGTIRSSQSENPNNARLCKYIASSLPKNGQRRRFRHILQRFGSIMDASNSIHNDEIRLLRTYRWIVVRVSIRTVLIIGDRRPATSWNRS